MTRVVAKKVFPKGAIVMIIGLDRTRLQHVATAAAISAARLANWLQAERPAPTRPSPFLKLAAQMA